jgi:hypothetical protein
VACTHPKTTPARQPLKIGDASTEERCRAYADDLLKIAVRARAKADFHWRGAEFMAVEEWPEGDKESWSHSLLPS